ncbi:MAG: SDR family oxidoreductase [Planctomyces sp.]|nr:SDR family oxidoreductase [Planctomyces sp.]
MPDITTGAPRVILITGASAGIGRAICSRLGVRGNQLVLAARSVEGLQRAVKEIETKGGSAVAVPTDVSDPNALETLVSECVSRFGRIDVLINNAGVDCFAEFAELSTEQILQTIETNLTGTILLTRLVIPHMLRQGAGSIVNMASTAGKHGPAFGAVYGATKAGMIAFTQGLRGEFHRQGIRVSVVCPGFTTHGGIYDRIVQSTGRGTPAVMGGTDAAHVAAAVESCIRKGAPEVIVNWPPMRPMFVIREMFPRLGEMMILTATRKFLKRISTGSRAGKVDER